MEFDLEKFSVLVIWTRISFSPIKAKRPLAEILDFFAVTEGRSSLDSGSGLNWSDFKEKLVLNVFVVSLNVAAFPRTSSAGD